MTVQEKIHLVKQFYLDFELDSRFSAYETWRAGERAEASDRLSHVEAKLNTKGVLTRAQRSGATAEREVLKKMILEDDPRWFSSEDLNNWLRKVNIITDEQHRVIRNDRRGEFRRTVINTMADADMIKSLGIAPFVLDAEGSSKYIVAKTLEQYQLDQTKRQLPGAETRLKGMSSKRRKISKVLEGYGGENDSLANTSRAGDQAINVILAVTDELKPMMVSICSQKDKLDILLSQSQKDTEEFQEFTKWKSEQAQLETSELGEE